MTKKQYISNKNGFTLLELLAVLIIMTSLTAMVIPIFMNKGLEAKKVVHNENIKILKEQANMYIMENKVERNTDITEELVESGLIKEIPENPLPKGVEESDPYRVSIDNKGNIKINVKYVDVIKKNKSEEVPLQNPDFNEVKGVNKPKLAMGMIPVKWNGGLLQEITEEDDGWYDYNNKQWANAVSKDVDGNITAYWVWIPRYKYYIPEENYHTNTAGVINIKFEKGIETTGSGQGHGVEESAYLTHPAFTFGTKNITGIWVAKFEASGSTSEINILPGKQALRKKQINDTFIACRDMKIINGEKYGWKTTGDKIDTHLIKNIEWGSVAYLANSTYGILGEVEINSNSSYYTGGGTGDSYISNVNQSTTGNEYGVYDISGGSWEQVAAFVNNDNNIINKYGKSLKDSYENYGQKYVDVYSKGTSDTRYDNYDAAVVRKGDALYETSSGQGNSHSWYGDFERFAYEIYPFFSRGGHYADGDNAGVFTVIYDDGGIYDSESFRPVLIAQ